MEKQIEKKEQSKKIKIYHAGGRSSSYSHWVPNREIVDNIEDADLVFGNGGSDLDCRIYGETKTHPRSWGGARMESDTELRDLKRAVELKIPVWGTCKGLQYNSGISGAKLIQDISHPGHHKITTEDGRTFAVNSLHHQMAYPFNLPKSKYRIIGWADNLSPHHEDGYENEMETPVEPEIVYYPETRMLGSQFHP